jgi:hypothetical protein
MAAPSGNSAASSMEEVVLSQYSLLRNIFKRLPTSDLKTTAQVNSTWKSVAERTAKDGVRRKVESFSWIGEAVNKAFYLDHEMFKSPKHEEMAAALKRHMSETMVHPETAVILHASEYDFDCDENDGIGADVDRMKDGSGADVDRLIAYLPPGCTAVSMGFGGIVGFNEGDGKSVEVENARLLKNPSVSIMLFPNRSNVKVIPFKVPESSKGIKESLNGKDITSNDPECRRALFRRALLHSATRGQLDDGDKIKCVLALTNCHEAPHAQFLLQEIGTRTGNKFAVGGAMGCMPHISSETLENGTKSLVEKELINEMGTGEDWSTTGLVFAGDGVEAASVMLNDKVRTEKAAEAALSRLKGPWMGEGKETCAFMFACCGRGVGLYRGKKNVESRIFQKLFPKTPLIGVFGNGEIGLEYVPVVSDENDDSPPKKPRTKEEEKDNEEEEKKEEELPLLSSDELLHTYTSVYVMLSFKQ